MRRACKILGAPPTYLNIDERMLLFLPRTTPAGVGRLQNEHQSHLERKPVTDGIDSQNCCDPLEMVETAAQPVSDHAHRAVMAFSQYPPDAAQVLRLLVDSGAQPNVAKPGGIGVVTMDSAFAGLPAAEALAKELPGWGMIGNVYTHSAGIPVDFLRSLCDSHHGHIRTAGTRYFMLSKLPDTDTKVCAHALQCSLRIRARLSRFPDFYLSSQSFSKISLT